MSILYCIQVGDTSGLNMSSQDESCSNVNKITLMQCINVDLLIETTCHDNSCVSFFHGFAVLTNSKHVCFIMYKNCTWRNECFLINFFLFFGGVPLMRERTSCLLHFPAQAILRGVLLSRVSIDYTYNTSIKRWRILPVHHYNKETLYKY